MNNRERTLNILHFKPVDRFPVVHFGYWRELLTEWAEQGKISRELAAVDAEIERVKRLASLGGFIPCPDHRLMPGSHFELVQYYAEEIKKINL